MRASWFRGRAPDELDASHEHEAPVAHVVQRPPDAGAPGPTVQRPPDAGAPGPTAGPVVPLMRPAFCHPTF